MIGWLQRLVRNARAPAPIPPDLWAGTLRDYPFLAAIEPPELQARLRRLSEHFLARKEFHGVGEVQVSDAMAVAIAAQACLPLLYRAPADRPEQELHWYDDFVGIVVQAASVRARRSVQDEIGVVHEYQEELSGEAQDGGPVMLSWDAVAEAGKTAAEGYNVVIHEFAHKIDLCDGLADGCPPLPPGFMGHARAADARAAWHRLFGSAADTFAQQVEGAERFPGMIQAPWLDSYAAQSPVEFFAVLTEAYFVNPERVALEFAALMPWLDAFFRPDRR